MIGEFKFIENGEVVDVVRNTITNTGKKQLLQYIGKLRDGWADQMHFGVGTGAADATNEWMGLEVYDCPIYVSRVDTSTGQITLKASIDTDAQFRFSELGIRPSPIFTDPAAASAQKLISFDTSEAYTLVPGISTSPSFVSKSNSTYGQYVKDGEDALFLAGGGDSAIFEVNLDLSSYPQTSKVLIGVTPSATFASGYGSYIDLNVGGDSAKKFKYTMTGGTINTYNIVAVPLSSFVAQGGAVLSDLANIESITVFDGLGTQVWDTMRIEKQDNSIITDVLFCRAQIGSTKTKWSGAPLDIEYTVTIGV